MASTPNQIAVAAKCFIKSIAPGDQIGCAICLWNIMSGLNLTPNQLKAASKCFTAAGGFPAGDQMGALLYLINQGGGGGGSGSVSSGIGSPQGVVTPASGTVIYFDNTVPSQPNIWYNTTGSINGWNEFIGS